MSRLIHNNSMHASVIAALVSFAVLIAAVSILSIMSERQAARIMTDLDRIHVQQLNEINRADALLNVARVSLEIASSQVLLGRMADANAQLDVAVDRMERAEVRLNNFIAAPKSERAQEMDFRTQAERFVYIIMAALAIAAVVLVLVYVGLRATVIHPLNSVVKHLQTIAKADLTGKISEGGRNEIGKLFNAMRNLQQSLPRIVGKKPALAKPNVQARAASHEVTEVDPKPRRKSQREPVAEGEWEEF
jgi:ABC-type multidrug transport system fused ATPase/permease subunit